MHRLGTIGFVYDDWTGVFYPPKVKAERRLELYARQFNTVEIDTTFHAIPPRDRVRRWEAVTPADFTFSVKAPRDITHEGLVGAESTNTMTRTFLDTMRLLGDKLGVVLLQFPPSFVSARRDDLLRLLDVLAEPEYRGLRYAIELRHDSWWSDATVQLLRQRNLAWAGSDQPTPEVAGVSPADTAAGGGIRAPRPLIVTTDFLFIRWVGNHGQFPSNAEQFVDPTPRLAWWVDQLRPITRDSPGGGKASPIREVFGYCGNSYAGHAPATCRTLMELLGLPLPEPLDVDESQGSLF
ncbi:MAG: DUF72 domain-containing protein [Planctomycetota bacterium]